MFSSNSRKFILLIVIIFLLIAGLNMRFADTTTNNDGVVHNISSISPETESWDDLNFLAKELEGKRIVVIGESLHSDGSTIIAKTRLVKYLHN